jgi:3-oxoacyl-[acyl-carrier protein] reductase
MSRSIAREVASRGITCNVVSPGPVDTEMIADLSDIARERLRGLTAVGRFATSDEVGLLVSYLCSRDAAFVTGAVIPIDGGLAMGM